MSEGFFECVDSIRLTVESMGVCLDPSDCNPRISGLSVGPFRGYPCDWLISRYGRFRRWRIRSALGLLWGFRGW